MKNLIFVSKDFIQQSLEMAEDLYGLADMNKNKELKQKLKKHIVKCNQYIAKLEADEK